MHIPIDQEKWERIKRVYPVGTVVTGTVAHHAPFGFFVTLPEDALGLVEFTCLPSEIKQMDSFPAIGTSVTGVVVHAEDGNQQLRLSMMPEDLADPEHAPHRLRAK